MWIVMNDAFLSIIENEKNENQYVVRARKRQDLVNVFPEHSSNVIETLDSDYRYRLFLERTYVSDVIFNRINSIDYPNFKNSVKETWRKIAYTKIWRIMHNEQDGDKWQNGYYLRKKI